MAQTSDGDAAARRAYEALAKVIGAVNARAIATRSTGFRVPDLEDDPAADDPTNAWILEDGRFCWRTADGAVHRIYPQADQPYPILTRSSNPAASTGIDFYVHGPTKTLRVRAANGDWITVGPASPSGSSSDGGGNSGGGSHSSKPKPPDPKPSRHHDTFAPTSAYTYDAAHGRHGGGLLKYGDVGAPHGERKIMLYFNAADIRDRMPVDARHVVAKLHMRNTHAWDDNGITVHFGTHNEPTPTTHFHQNRRNIFRDHWPKSGSGKDWRSGAGLDAIGRRFRDDQARGLTIDQTSNSRSQYGQMDWDSLRLYLEWVV